MNGGMTMNIDKLKTASKLLEEIEDHQEAINSWKSKEPEDCFYYFEHIIKEDFTALKNNTIANLEHKKRQLETEFENL